VDANADDDIEVDRNSPIGFAHKRHSGNVAIASVSGHNLPEEDTNAGGDAKMDRNSPMSFSHEYHSGNMAIVDAPNLPLMAVVNGHNLPLMESDEDANAQGDMAIAHAHDDDFQLIESEDLVRPSQNIRVMPRLEQ
jgi:hypothetical protein